MFLSFENLQTLVLAQLWQVTLLIPLAIVSVRLTCRRRSHLAYGILLAVLLKCVVPPLWSSPAGMFSWLAHAVESTKTAASSTDGPSIPAAASGVTEKASNSASGNGSDQLRVPASDLSEAFPKRAVPESLPPVAMESERWQWVFAGCLMLWGGGVLSILGYLLAKRIYLEQFHDDTRVESECELLEIVNQTAVALNLKRCPDLVVTTHPTIPFVVGWWLPRLVVSRQIVDRSSREEMQLIIAHELNHLRRWDTGTNWLQLLVQAVWWFHPGVWWLNAEIRRWRESCCDEEVVARLQCPPSRYAHTLLNVLEWQTTLRVTTGFANLSPLEVTRQRLQNIMRPAVPFSRSAPLMVWVVFGGVLLVVLPGAQFANLPPTAAIAHDEIPDPPQSFEGQPPSKAETIQTPQEPEPTTGQGPPLPPPPVVEVSPAVANARVWKYKPDVRRSFTYGVSIQENGLQGGTRHTGQPVVQATYISGGDWELKMRNSELSTFDIPSSTAPFRGMRPPRIPGPFEGEYTATISARGRLIDEQGESPLPLYLGQWGTWLFRPLPEGDGDQWTVAGEQSLTNPTTPPPNPFGPPRIIPFTPASSPARQLADFQHVIQRTITPQGLLLKTARTLTSREEVNGTPSLELREDSTWSFDAKLGMPTELRGQGTLIQRRLNQETTTPFEYTVTLVTDDNAPPAAAGNP